MSSMRSRQTGQVGSSTREGVGGGRGFRARLAAFGSVGLNVVDNVGVKGSWDMSGNELEAAARLEAGEGVSNMMDLMKMT